MDTSNAMGIGVFAASEFFDLPWWQCVFFASSVLINIEGLSFGIPLFFSLLPSRIPPGGKPLYNRLPIDFFYIAWNKCMTIMYTYHLLRFVWTNPQHIKFHLSEISVTNTIISLLGFFLLYDIFYYSFHRLLHVRSIYGYIHKHHHKQICPIRGHDDAVNTHPFEYLIGMYIHLLVVYLIPSHAITVFLFLVTGGLMSSLNHTRYDVHLGFIFSVRDHDMHHRIPQSNYGQYTQIWDRLFGTFQVWKKSPSPWVKHDPYASNIKLPQRPDPVKIPEMCTIEACTRTRMEYQSIKDAPKTCLVTGGQGLVGKRLVSMLIERGAMKVISIDLTLPNFEQPIPYPDQIEYIVCDITSKEKLLSVFKEQQVDTVFHVAALVGPYHSREAYMRVNYHGTLNLLDACRATGVKKLVMTSSPTTRLDGNNVYGLGEEKLSHPPKQYLQEYARTKAMGEKAVLEACTESFLTCALAPHQVYGPEDRLFLPNFIVSAKKGVLRIIGDGNNVISFTHIDNICHAQILASAALKEKDSSPAGEFYLVTDGSGHYLWDAIDTAVIECGFTSLRTLAFIPTWFLMPISNVMFYIASYAGFHFKLSPFAVKMVTIHRYFDIKKVCHDIGYRPIVAFEEGWTQTIKEVKKRMDISS